MTAISRDELWPSYSGDLLFTNASTCIRPPPKSTEDECHSPQLTLGQSPFSVLFSSRNLPRPCHLRLSHRLSVNVQWIFDNLACFDIGRHPSARHTWCISAYYCPFARPFDSWCIVCPSEQALRCCCAWTQHNSEGRKQIFTHGKVRGDGALGLRFLLKLSICFTHFGSWSEMYIAPAQRRSPPPLRRGFKFIEIWQQ